MPVIESMTDVGVMGYLTVLLWCDWLAPTVTIWSDFQLFKLWHRHFSKHIWLPPLLFFPIVIVAIYILIQAALFAWFRNVFSAATDPDWTPTAIFFLSFFMVLFTKQWIAVYAIGGRMRFAFVNLVGMLGTSVAVLGIMGSYQHWQEFGCLVFYLPFWLGAAYLNVRAFLLEESGAYRSEIDRREWSEETQAYSPLKTQQVTQGAPDVMQHHEIF